uniref:Photosystem I reaction center subunit XI n=1 Tax=Cyanidium sp. THAL103 TaxID=3027999 RepID=A0A9Y1I418_9RHOD|nr:photosystem I subunit XI [Cyanidium sp. THAL103]
MIDYIKTYNDDPFVGNLATPVNTSNLTKFWLSNLPIYRKGLSSLLRGLEIGMAHGYFLIGPFYKLGPLRNTDMNLISALLSTVGLIIVISIGLIIYGVVSFSSSEIDDKLKTPDGWKQLSSGFLLGAVGGAAFAYLLLSNNVHYKKYFLFIHVMICCYS